MSDLLRGGAAIVVRDARIFWSYRFRPIKELVTAALTVVLFYELAGLVSSRRFPSADAYFSYAAVGLALLPLMRAAIVQPALALREEIVTGSFERLVLSPMGATAGLIASLVCPFAIGLVNGTLVLLVGFAFGVDIQLSTAALALPVAALGALAMAPISTLLLAIGVLVKQVGSGSGWILSGLSLLGGVYFPPALLPDWIHWSADVQPVTPTLDLLRHVLTGSPAVDPVATELFRLAVFAVLGLAITSVALRAACDLARRHGTLFES